MDLEIDTEDARHEPAPLVRPEAEQAVLAAEGELTEEQIDTALAAASYGDLTADHGQRERLTKWSPPGEPIERQVRALISRSEESVVGQTDAERKAWTKVSEAHAEVEEARASLAAIDAERAEEERAADEVVADQLRAGKPAKAPAGADWALEERTRRASVRVRVEGLAHARRAFDAVSARERDKRVPAALERLRDAEGKARKVTPAALAAFEEWRAALHEAETVVVAHDGEGSAVGVNRYRLTEEARRVLREGEAAPAALRRLLNSDHPWLSGAYLSEGDELDVPIWAREALADSRRESDVAALADLEAREHFEVTQLAMAYARATGRVRPVERRAMGG